MTDKGKGGQVATKTIFNRGNFRLWSKEMKLLLNYHGLKKYITKETFKFVRSYEIPKGEETKYKKVEDPSVYYIKMEITDEQIESDNETKFYFNNSISEEIKQSLNFDTRTAYQICKIIEGMNIKGKEERIIEIKDQLENITYDPENDISLFIYELNMLFDELEDLDHRLTKEKKFNYLYTAILTQISMEISLISFKGKWEDAF